MSRIFDRKPTSRSCSARPSSKLLIFLEGAAAAGAVGHDVIDIRSEKKVEVDQGQTPGAFPIPLGQMRRPAAFDIPRGDDFEALLGKDPGGLPRHLGKNQTHRAAEEKGHPAPFLPEGGDDGGDLQTKRTCPRGAGDLPVWQGHRAETCRSRDWRTAHWRPSRW